jgi:hypothetical protein
VMVAIWVGTAPIKRMLALSLGNILTANRRSKGALTQCWCGRER